MSTTFTKSGTVPQKGIDRLKYINLFTEKVIAYPRILVDKTTRNGELISSGAGEDYSYNWSDYDYVIHLTAPKIQLRLPMYMRYNPNTISVVTSLHPSAQALVVGGGTWQLKDCSNAQYSFDGTNWQPFTGQEVI